jgi:acylphosphatase
MEERRGYRVRGRVQGVGFRWWTQRYAETLGLRGTVRNLPDGTVEVQACGSPEQLTSLEAGLREGPSGARVDGVDALDTAGDLPGRGFSIEGW